MKHDLEAFSRDLVTLIKTSGDTGDSGDKSKKSLRHSDNFVPTSRAVVSPLALEWGQPVSVSGDRKAERSQSLESSVPTVPSVATRFDRVEIAELGSDYPSAWHAILAELSRQQPVSGFSVQHWHDVLLDSKRFLQTWGSAAKRLGWVSLDLFGVHPAAPSGRVGCWGLLLLVRGGDVIAITDRSATIRRPSNNLLTFRRVTVSNEILLSEVNHEAR